jgi:hypothetical protein
LNRLLTLIGQGQEDIEILEGKQKKMPPEALQQIRDT